SDLKQPANWLVEFDPALPAVHMGSAQRHDVISHVAPLLHGEGPLVELLVDLAKPAADAFAAAQETAFHKPPTHDLHLRVDLIRKRTLPRIPPAERVLHKFDVLLRHRPRSISRTA